MRPKVFIVDHDPSIARMFMDNDWLVVPDPEEADLIQFTGGEDVSPMLYWERKHPATYCNPDRDQTEANVFFDYYAKPKAGICRGGQFLNVMSGGAMYQHVDNHAIHGTHEAVDPFTGETYQVTSTHHQMMETGEWGDVFLVAENLATFKENGEQGNQRNAGESDIEGVFYSRTNSMCFQPHPEYVEPGHECQTLYFDKLKQFFDLGV